MWFKIIIIAVIIGAIVGFFSSRDGEKGSGAVGGALAGGIGCGLILFRIFLWGLGIFLAIMLFRFLFG